MIFRHIVKLLIVLLGISAGAQEIKLRGYIGFGIVEDKFVVDSVNKMKLTYDAVYLDIGCYSSDLVYEKQHDGYAQIYHPNGIIEGKTSYISQAGWPKTPAIGFIDFQAVPIITRVCIFTVSGVKIADEMIEMLPPGKLKIQMNGEREFMIPNNAQHVYISVDGGKVWEGGPMLDDPDAEYNIVKRVNRDGYSAVIFDKSVDPGKICLFVSSIEHAGDKTRLMYGVWPSHVKVVFADKTASTSSKSIKKPQRKISK